MDAEILDVVRGSGNVFRDLGREKAHLEQLKALLAAEIIKALASRRTDAPGGAGPNRRRGGGLFSYPERSPRHDHS